MRLKRILPFFAAAALLAPASNAQDSLFGFAFNRLDGDYSGNSSGGTFTANASGMGQGGPFNSDGYVERLLPVQGVASFESGWRNSNQTADVQTSFTISNVTGSGIGSTADAVGTFTFFDADGDWITGTITGQFLLGEAGATMEGTLSSISVFDPANEFNGPSGGSFDLDFPLTKWLGTSTTLVFTGGWFDQAFSDIRTDFDGVVVVPVPGAALLGSVGLFIAGRARRRLA